MIVYVCDDIWRCLLLKYLARLPTLYLLRKKLNVVNLLYVRFSRKVDVMELRKLFGKHFITGGTAGDRELVGIFMFKRAVWKGFTAVS
jgi:hypothetical protein